MALVRPNLLTRFMLFIQLFHCPGSASHLPEYVLTPYSDDLALWQTAPYGPGHETASSAAVLIVSSMG